MPYDVSQLFRLQIQKANFRTPVGTDEFATKAITAFRGLLKKIDTFLEKGNKAAVTDKGAMCSMFYKHFKGKNQLQLAGYGTKLVVKATHLHYVKIDHAFQGPPAEDAADSDTN
eukprot:gene6098-7318_t